MDSSPRGGDAPEIFYRTCHTYRNLRTILMLPLALLLAAPFVYGVIHKSPHGPPTFVLYVGAFIFLAFFFTGLDKILHNTQEVSEINAGGVSHRDKRWGWPDVISIEASRQSFSQSVRVKIKTKNPPMLFFMGIDPMTRAEYEVLADRLRQFLGARYPDIRVER